MILKITESNWEKYVEFFASFGFYTSRTKATNMEAAKKEVGPFLNWVSKSLAGDRKAAALRLPLPDDEPYFTINEKTRAIEVPAAFKQNGLGVVGDHAAETVYFKFPRYFDAYDLHQVAEVNTREYSPLSGIYIQWQCGQTTGASRAYAPTASDDELIFGWVMDNAITENSGNINFSVRFALFKQSTDLNGNESFDIVYNLATQPATCSVKGGLNLDKNVLQVAKDLRDNLLNRKLYSGIMDSSTVPAPYFIKDLPVEIDLELYSDTQMVNVINLAIADEENDTFDFIPAEIASLEDVIGGGEPVEGEDAEEGAVTEGKTVAELLIENDWTKDTVGNWYKIRLDEETGEDLGPCVSLDIEAAVALDASIETSALTCLWTENVGTAGEATDLNTIDHGTVENTDGTVELNSIEESRIVDHAGRYNVRVEHAGKINYPDATQLEEEMLVSRSTNSRICVVPGPNQNSTVDFSALPGSVFVDDRERDAKYATTLQVSASGYNEDKDVVTYKWFGTHEVIKMEDDVVLKDEKGNIVTEIVDIEIPEEDNGQATFVPKEAGDYNVLVTVTRNNNDAKYVGSGKKDPGRLEFISSETMTPVHVVGNPVAIADDDITLVAEFINAGPKGETVVFEDESQEYFDFIDQIGKTPDSLYVKFAENKEYLADDCIYIWRTMEGIIEDPQILLAGEKTQRILNPQPGKTYDVFVAQRKEIVDDTGKIVVRYTPKVNTYASVLYTGKKEIDANVGTTRESNAFSIPIIAKK